MGALTAGVRKRILGDPYYIPEDQADEVGEIARKLHIAHACSVIIDVVNFPTFLPSPRSRRFQVGSEEVIGECFLVPHEDPKEWASGKIARFPLHRCKFEDFEIRYAQVVLINTAEDRGTAQYVFDKFHKECARQRIQLTKRPGGW